jgi:hypothetical protein
MSGWGDGVEYSKKDKKNQNNRTYIPRLRPVLRLCDVMPPLAVPPEEQHFKRHALARGIIQPTDVVREARPLRRRGTRCVAVVLALNEAEVLLGLGMRGLAFWWYGGGESRDTGSPREGERGERYIYKVKVAVICCVLGLRKVAFLYRVFEVESALLRTGGGGGVGGAHGVEEDQQGTEGEDGAGW